MKRAASLTQPGTTLVGATTRKGPRPGIALAGVADERQRLERLAEPHVVGEDAAELEAPERREPPEALALVGPQLRVQRGGQRVLGDRIELEQCSDLPLPRLRLLGDDAEGGELVPQACLVAADPQRLRRPVGEGSGLRDQLAQRLQAGLEQREVGAVREQHLRLAVRERLEHRGERQLAPLDADRDAEAEPIALAVELPCRDGDLERLADVAVVGRPRRSPRR